MSAEMHLKDLAGAFLGTRVEGKALRLNLEKLLREHQRVRLDYSGVSTTQSCADEFVGVLFALEGSPLLERIVFANCSATVRTILEFVITARLQDNERLQRAQRTRDHLLESGLLVR